MIRVMSSSFSYDAEAKRWSLQSVNHHSLPLVEGYPGNPFPFSAHDASKLCIQSYCGSAAQGLEDRKTHPNLPGFLAHEELKEAMRQSLPEGVDAEEAIRAYPWDTHVRAIVEHGDLGCLEFFKGHLLSEETRQVLIRWRSKKPIADLLRDQNALLRAR